LAGQEKRMQRGELGGGARVGGNERREKNLFHCKETAWMRKQWKRGVSKKGDVRK